MTVWVYIHLTVHERQSLAVTIAGVDVRRSGLRRGRLQSEPVTSAMLGSTPEASASAAEGSR